jgi:hypothetical protein
MLNNILIILFILYIIISGFALRKFIINTRKKYKNIKIVLIVSFLVFILLFAYYLYKDCYTQKGGFVNYKGHGQKHPEKIPKLLNACGLPQNYNATSHCFADGTHQTCCMLGPQARKYADESGNPIGEASVKAFRENYGRYPKKNELTGWCTCFGSKVCSAYAKKFNDGTHIKFVNNPKNKTKIRSKVHQDCEGYFRDKFSIRKHGTPGINNNFSGSNSHEGKLCENANKSLLEDI